MHLLHFLHSTIKSINLLDCEWSTIHTIQSRTYQVNFHIDHLPSEMVKIESFKQEHRGETYLKTSLSLALLVGKNLECPGDADGHNGWLEVAAPCFLTWMLMRSVTEPQHKLFFCSSAGYYLPRLANLFTRLSPMVHNGQGMIAMTGKAHHFNSADDADDDHGRVYFSFKGSKTCQVCLLPFKKITLLS